MERVINMSILDTEQIDTRYSNETTPETIEVMLSTGKLTQSEIIEEFIYKKVILAVCVFGIIGNILNLIILSQKSLTYMMERMEKSAHYGLIALAISDLFVCITALPSVIYGTGKKNGGFAHDSFDFRLVHKLYSNGVINTFMLSSTWLTVTMAVSRYIAICHPLRARQIIGKTFTITSLVAVFVVSVLFNVPRFLWQEHRSIVVDGGRRMYFAYPGPLRRRAGDELELAYLWAYFTLGIAVPLCVLVYCNMHLIKTLRMSMLSHTMVVQNSFSLSGSGQTSFHRTVRPAAPQRTTRERSEQAAYRITLTLIIIIILFAVLFVPSELVNFFVDVAAQTTYKTEVFNVAVTVGNLLQTINFAVNFVLYSAVNTYFRYTIYRMVKCTRCRSTDTREILHGYKRTATATAARVDGEMVWLNSRAGRCVDTEHPSNVVQQHLTTTWRGSRHATTPTVAVSYV